MSTLLDGRTAIIYGGGGSIGGAVARRFADEGAHVFLAGRTESRLADVAKDIAQRGGHADYAVLDATDEQAIETHVAGVVARTGRIDVSFNLVGRPDVQGTPLVDMTKDDLLRAVVTGLTAQFVTARAAAKRMIAQRSGVLLHLNSASGDGAMPGMGSTGPADAASESFMRYLAAEVGQFGVRVCGIWTAGVAETLTTEKLTAVGGPETPAPSTVEEMIAGMSALRRTPRLADVANTAAFLASDHAAGITGTMANVTCGLVLR